MNANICVAAPSGQPMMKQHGHASVSPAVIELYTQSWFMQITPRQCQEKDTDTDTDTVAQIQTQQHRHDIAAQTQTQQHRQAAGVAVSKARRESSYFMPSWFMQITPKQCQDKDQTQQHRQTSCRSGSKKGQKRVLTLHSQLVHGGRHWDASRKLIVAEQGHLQVAAVL